MNSSSSMENDSSAGPFPGPPPPGYYRNVTIEIWTYVPPIIISIGTVGNLLTIIVILRQVHHISSTSLFLLSLAFSDLLVLYTGPLRQWILHNKAWNHDDVRLNSEGSCRVHTFLTYVSIQFSSWLLVAVTMERLLSVMLPHKVKSLSTLKAAGIAIVSIAVFLIALNGHFLFGIGYGFVEEQSRQQKIQVYHKCWPKTSSYKDFNDDVFPWIDFLVAFAIPNIILTVCNIIIIVRLAMTRKHRRKMSVNQGSHLRSIEKDNRVVTILLVCLCVLFFICLAPVSIYFIGQPYWIDEITSRPITSPMDDPEQFLKDVLQIQYDMEYLLFWHAVVNCLGYLNATCNFIFYVISGSKFRREIVTLLCCRRPGHVSVFGSSTRSRTTSSSLQSKTSVRPSVHTTTSNLPLAAAPGVSLASNDGTDKPMGPSEESITLATVSSPNIY